MISIFTPTYNRAHTIERVWKSLKNQTVKPLEWIVIDDGSTDDIESKIDSYISENLFRITFLKFRQNQGKHIAINKAVELAEGEFFVIADSDDEFKSDTLEFFLATWNTIPIAEKDSFCGIRVCCEDQFGNRISDNLPRTPIDLTMTEAFYKYKFRNESWCMIKTKLHRQYKFPVEHLGSYYPEGIIWKRISTNTKIRFVNDIKRIYYINDGDSLIFGEKTKKEKASGSLPLSIDILNNDLTYFFYYPKYFIVALLSLCFYIFHSEQKKQYFKSIKIHVWVIIILLLPIIGVSLSLHTIITNAKKTLKR